MYSNIICRYLIFFQSDILSLRHYSTKNNKISTIFILLTVVIILILIIESVDLWIVLNKLSFSQIFM